MDKKKEKSFIRTNIIISAVTMLIIWLVCYFMKDMEWWKLMIALFIILICSTVFNSLNIIFHIKKK